ncbi:MAG: 30S ribosomal protein S4 [Candidatus Aenigmarchaeota archaeon]|nr:30S ribosomal protein S4 [Candidatus Aenigmarchaeota archaeon]MCK5234600.1 30S ribosomal protein S4 [Candidatus Aenigmarchaeota archaeon]MCK5373130.1 30S ribosomal protein S4 [Candidatus Aenigmarchaeota archaeon]MCK5452176.1 30S ribosomal protein S4 [Candidatus Aenigmarchaeota archaeon]
MGDPRRSKKAFSRPTRPYDKDRITAEKVLMNDFGLRRKNEIYRAEAFIRDVKRRARMIIASKDDDAEKTLLQKVVKYGMIGEKEVSIDTILDFDVKAFLERRLETQVVRKKLANSHFQARQFIVHGHIFVDGVKVTSPKYIVCQDEENLISFSSRSALASSFEHAPKKVKERVISPQQGRFGRGRPFNRRGGGAPFNRQGGAPFNRQGGAPFNKQGGAAPAGAKPATTGGADK